MTLTSTCPRDLTARFGSSSRDEDELLIKREKQKEQKRPAALDDAEKRLVARAHAREGVCLPPSRWPPLTLPRAPQEIGSLSVFLLFPIIPRGVERAASQCETFLHQCLICARAADEARGRRDGRKGRIHQMAAVLRHLSADLVDGECSSTRAQFGFPSASRGRGGASLPSPWKSFWSKKSNSVRVYLDAAAEGPSVRCAPLFRSRCDTPRGVPGQQKVRPARETASSALTRAARPADLWHPPHWRGAGGEGPLHSGSFVVRSKRGGTSKSCRAGFFTEQLIRNARQTGTPDCVSGSGSDAETCGRVHRSGGNKGSFIPPGTGARAPDSS